MKIERLPKLNSIEKKPDFGVKIKKARLECGMSQIELAKAVGWSTATALSLIESNQRGIQAKELWLISQVTNLPITFFYHV